MKKNLGAKTVIAPLPVFIIGTYDENGTPNAMNAAWGTQCDFDKVFILLGEHKTTDNLKIKRAFTLAFATPETLEISDYFGIESGCKTDKIKQAKAHISKAKFVDAPVIEEYPLTLECEVVELREGDDEFRVIGKIVNTVADESILNGKGEIDLGKLKPLCYDSAAKKYRVLGDVVGSAFRDGLKIKNKP
ncbi:MAG: flavin reductase family protein [Opitutales bacterium]|nr:flavin reductase family protein [Opitutales bacterium]